MQLDWITWLSLVEVPALAGLLAYVLAARREVVEQGVRALGELYAFKLEVARNYATVGYLKDVEDRLARRLDRIEEKLDRIARATQAETGRS